MDQTQHTSGLHPAHSHQPVTFTHRQERSASSRNTRVSALPGHVFAGREREPAERTVTGAPQPCPPAPKGASGQPYISPPHAGPQNRSLLASSPCQLCPQAHPREPLIHPAPSLSTSSLSLPDTKDSRKAPLHPKLLPAPPNSTLLLQPGPNQLASDRLPPSGTQPVLIPHQARSRDPGAAQLRPALPCPCERPGLTGGPSA